MLNNFKQFCRQGRVLSFVLAIIAVSPAIVATGDEKARDKATISNKGPRSKSDPKNNRGATNKQKPPTISLPASVRKQADVDLNVAQIDRSQRSSTRQYAAKIDRAINQHLANAGTEPNRLSSDATFVRRIYLDLAGRIPTREETLAFFTSTAPDKREMLIDDLLESPDYVSNFYNMWADVLRLTERPENNIIADPYLAYVKQSIAANKPYDKWVYEMLTADGKLWENPAAGYQMRDNGMPLPYVDNTVRIFLGTQIGCAQCHDHPFDEWTQHQFYQLASFTAGTNTRMANNNKDKKTKGNPANSIIAEAKKRNLPRQEFGSMQRLVRANTYAVSETSRRLRLPHDYAYSDAKPNDLVEPEVLWGEIPTSAAQGTRREQFAAWLTSAENPAFPKTIANRIWHRLTGVGVVEPIDDFNDDNEPFSEELLNVLSEEIVDMNFDVRELVRAIVYSQSYQRESSVYDRSTAEPYVFVGPTLRRMTAEQVWDSILTLTAYNSWPFQRPTAEDIADAIDLDLPNLTFEQVQQRVADFDKSEAGNGYKRKLNKDFGYKGMVLAKASELPTPLPAGHFLRQFGQSDRETINGNNEDATVPQILTMFNGPITHSMLERGSRIYDLVAEAENPKEAIDSIFISVLSRTPDAEDRRIASNEITAASSRAIAAGNIIWALLNTREFLFVR